MLDTSIINNSNTIFWLHNGVTVVFLVLMAVIMNLNNYVGDPIHCIKNGGISSPEFGDNFCWVYGTSSGILKFSASCITSYFVVSADRKELGSCNTKDDNTLHDYYQWVALTLIAQAIVFYFPGWLWGQHEGRKVEDVLGKNNGVKAWDLLGETKQSLETRAEEVAGKVVLLTGSHTTWAAVFLLCELMNLGAVVANIFFTNMFLNNNFLEYGFDVLKYVSDYNELNEDCHPMEKVHDQKLLTQ